MLKVTRLRTDGAPRPRLHYGAPNDRSTDVALPDLQPGPDGHHALPRGRYTCSVDELVAAFVTGRPDEAHRAGLMADLRAYLGRLGDIGLVIDSVWVDGSFTSAKINPGDIDCSPVIDAAASNPAASETPYLVDRWIHPKDRWKHASVPGLGHTVALDVYGFAMVPDGTPGTATALAVRGHWDQFWQRSRTTGQAHVKGFVEVIF